MYLTTRQACLAHQPSLSAGPGRWKCIVKPADLGAALRLAGTGDEQAIAALYRALQPALLRYLRHEAPDAAEDLASETWLGAAQGLASFEGGIDAFRAFLFTIARRRVADHYRTTARRPRLVPLEGDPDGSRVAESAEVVVDRLSDQEAVEALLANLAPDQAEVLLLRVVGGLNVEQVAEILGRNPGAVRMLQHRAIQKLQRIPAGP
jgi:RNA polymerase sigma-70 factor (ECF subfamily)